MGGHGVGPQDARNAHGRVGCIREDAQGVVSLPAADEVVVGGALESARQQGRERGGADPQILPPRTEDGVVGVGRAGRDRREAPLRLGEDACPGCLEVVHEFRQARERDVGPTLGDEPRVLPTHEVARVAVTRVRRDEKQRLIAVAVERDADFLPRDQRRHRLLPGLRSVRLADVADRRESPQCLLPRFDVG